MPEAYNNAIASATIRGFPQLSPDMKEEATKSTRQVINSFKSSAIPFRRSCHVIAQIKDVFSELVFLFGSLLLHYSCI